jgi:hypothetical protein
VTRSTTLTTRNNNLSKESIAWDLPCYLFTFNHLIHMHVSTLITTKDFLAFVLIPCHLWDIALGSDASAQLKP